MRGKGKESSSIIISNPELEEQDAEVELSALITSSDNLFDPFKLWYRFPLDFKDYIALNGDPFLAAVLPMAMIKKCNLSIEVPISNQLYINCGQIIKIFSSWFENMKPIQIRATCSQTDSSKPEAVGSFFTGGVDSFYTVLKNLKEFNNEMSISHLIYIHGFDIRLENHGLYQSVKKEIAAISRDLKLTPMFIKTNLRLLTDRQTKWGKQQHGAALASTALCLKNLFNTVFIPSSHTFSQLRPWASHPILDPLWSNGKTRFIHDGNEATRFQKITWQIGSARAALDHLRVCWKNTDGLYNCGTCGKCIRTKINLKLAGALEQCKTLDNAIDLERYADILNHNKSERVMLAETVSNLNRYSKHNSFEKYLLDLTRKPQKKELLRMNKIKNRIRIFLQR